VFAVYNQAINHFDQVNHIVKGTPASVATYSTFATFPAPYFGSIWGPLVDQIVGTFFLVLFVFACIDVWNTGVKANLAPFIIGMVVMAVGISFGANAGYAINPARDFGPRMFALVAGWGKVAFPGDYGNVNTYFWIPIVGPMIGGSIAAVMYNLGIRDILSARRLTGEEPEPGRAGEPASQQPPEVDEE
jgi:glycerol uptake facilitator protein